MSEPTFTKGPWQAFVEYAETDDDKPDTLVDCITIGAGMADVALVVMDPLEGTDVGNANLIVAAPDLYKALEDLLSEQNGPPLLRRQKEWKIACDAAYAALRKAEGQQP